jgi:hypothetical protein
MRAFWNVTDTLVTISRSADVAPSFKKSRRLISEWLRMGLFRQNN